MKGKWRVLRGLMVFWFLVLLYLSATMYNSSDVNERTTRQLGKALQELAQIKRQNEQLQSLTHVLRQVHAYSPILINTEVYGLAWFGWYYQFKECDWVRI